MKSKHILTFCSAFSILIALEFGAFSSFAAEIKPSTLIETGSAVVPPTQPKQAPAQTATTVPETLQLDVPANANSAESQDPCPLPEGQNSGAMNDLAKVQEDIDRYTLCIQRAELLSQLNEAEAKSGKVFDEAAGMKMPTLDDVSKQMPDSGVTQPPAAPNGMSAASTDGGEDMNLDSGSSDWTIESVSGNDRDLKAVLVSPNGTLLKAKVGTALPNDEGSVLFISSKDVQVRKGKKVRSLDWAKTSATAKPAKDGM